MVERAAEHVDRARELHTTHHHHEHVHDVHDVDYRADHDHGGDPINHDSDIHIYPDNYFDDVDDNHAGSDDLDRQLEHDARYEHVGTYSYRSEHDRSVYEHYIDEHRPDVYTRYLGPYVVLFRRLNR